MTTRAEGRGRRGLVRWLRRQEVPARAAIAAFFWATLVGPALHLIDHRDDHTHGGVTHRHEPASPPHRHRVATPATPTQDQTLPEPGSPHGAGDALHFGIAVLEGKGNAHLPAPDTAPELIPPARRLVVRPRPVSAANRPRGPPALRAAPTVS